MCPPRRAVVCRAARAAPLPSRSPRPCGGASPIRRTSPRRTRSEKCIGRSEEVVAGFDDAPPRTAPARSGSASSVPPPAAPAAGHPAPGSRHPSVGEDIEPKMGDPSSPSTSKPLTVAMPELAAGQQLLPRCTRQASSKPTPHASNERASVPPEVRGVHHDPLDLTGDAESDDAPIMSRRATPTAPRPSTCHGR